MFWMWTTVVAALALVVLGVAFFLQRLFYDPPLNSWRCRLNDWRWRKKQAKRRLPDCVEKYCHGQEAHNGHGHCVFCGELTCDRRAYVDENLRRRIGYVCSPCMWDQKRTALRTERTTNDWKRMTTPLENGLLVAGMGEQYPSYARSALRAFAESDLEEATIEDVTPSTLQTSITTLGLHKEMYAEQRGNDTVLRKIQPSEA